MYGYVHMYDKCQVRSPLLFILEDLQLGNPHTFELLGLVGVRTLNRELASV